MPDEPDSPLVELDLADNGGRIVANSLDELESWVQTEANFWQWFHSNTSNIGEIAQVSRQINTAFANFLKQINHTKGIAGQPQYQTQIDGLKNMILSAYTNGDLIHSSTPKAKFILSLKDRADGLTAALSYLYLIGRAFTVNSHQGATAIQEAFLFEKGIASAAAAEKEALEQLRSDWQAKLRHYMDDSVKITASVTELQNTLENTIKDATESLSGYNKDKEAELAGLCDRVQLEVTSLQSDTKKSLDALKNNATDKLNELITTFDEKLSLQAPVTYWTKKRKYHEAKASQMLGHLWRYGLVGIGCILTAGATTLGVVDKPDPSHYFFLIVFSGAILWILKLLVNIYLSHVHLELDAQERVTLAHSYLAFLRRGKGVEDSDRQIILQSLFKNTSSGLRKDDSGNPHVVLDVLERFKGSG